MLSFMVFISNFSTMLKYDQSAKYINKIKFRALFDKWVCEMLWRSRVNTKHQIWQELKHPAANFAGLQAALQSTFTVQYITIHTIQYIQYIFLYLPYFSHIHLHSTVVHTQCTMSQINNVKSVSWRVLETLFLKLKLWLIS